MINNYFTKALLLAITGSVLTIPYPQSHNTGMSVNGKANHSGSGYATSVNGQGSVSARNTPYKHVYNKPAGSKGSVSGRGSTKPITKYVKGRPGSANTGRGLAKPITGPSKGRPAPARNGKGTIKRTPNKTVGGKSTPVSRNPTRPVKKPVKGRGSTGIKAGSSKTGRNSYSSNQSTSMHDGMSMGNGEMSMDNGDMSMGDDDMKMEDDMPGMDHGSSGGGHGLSENHDMTQDEDDDEEDNKSLAGKVAGGVFGLVKDNPATRFLGAHCAHGHVCPQMPRNYIDQVKGVFNGDFDKVLNRQYDESMFHLGEKTPDDIGKVHSTIKTLTGY